MGQETRKLQLTGRSSYVVSLPKRWVEEMGLGRGDAVRVERRGASEIAISPSHAHAPRPGGGEAVMEVSSSEGHGTAIRRLVSLYFVGFRTIHVRSPGGRLGAGTRAAIKGAAKRMLVGAEIISDSSAGMTVQVLASLVELPVEGAFRRMLHLAKSMLSDAVIAAGEGDGELARQVIDADDEVDRFGFYIVRQIEIAVRDERMLVEMGFAGARSCLGYRLAVKDIERAGDHAAVLAADVLEFGRGVGPGAAAAVGRMAAFSSELLDSACAALLGGDYARAEGVIARAGGVARHEKAALDAAGAGREAWRVRRMAENIRRIAEHAGDIAEIALNLNVEGALRGQARRGAA